MNIFDVAFILGVICFLGMFCMTLLAGFAAVCFDSPRGTKRRKVARWLWVNAV